MIGVLFSAFNSMVHEKSLGGSAFFDDLSCWIPCDLITVYALGRVGAVANFRPAI